MPLTCAISTWNVGAAAGAEVAATTPGIDAWVLASQPTSADIHVIALQEACDINSPLAYLYNPLAGAAAVSAGAAVWETAVTNFLPQHTVVAKQELVGMVLIVLVASPHVAACSAARVTHMGTGPLGAGNKGAVAASLTIYGSSICIICSHLASGSKGTDSCQLLDHRRPSGACAMAAASPL